MAKPVPSLGTPISATNPATQTWYEFFQSILTDLKFAYDFAKGYVPPSDDTKSNIIRTVNKVNGTSHTFALAEAGDYFRFTSSSAVTVTIPPNSSVAFEAGTQFDGMASGTGAVSFAAGSGVTIISFGNNLKLAGKGAQFTLVQTDVIDTWELGGLLIA